MLEEGEFLRTMSERAVLGIQSTVDRRLQSLGFEAVYLYKERDPEGQRATQSSDGRNSRCVSSWMWVRNTMPLGGRLALATSI